MALFLAFQPGIDLLLTAEATEQSCCIDFCSPNEAAEAHHEDDGHDDGCEGNFCNPFQVCGCCFVLFQIRTTLPSSTKEMVPKQKFAYQTNLSSRFIFEFWQPPELA